MSDSESAALTRRTFVAQTALGAAAAVTGVRHRDAALPSSRTERHSGAQVPAKTPPIGIELYAVRKELARDLPNTLRTVRQTGYEVVEFYAPYLAWTLPYAKQVRTMMDDIGLRCYSTHNSIASLTPGDVMNKAIEINQILGSRSIILASPPFQSSVRDEWLRLCETLTAASTTLTPHGLSAGFHNHSVEWAKLPDDTRVMDVIATNTPTEFTLQLDVGTCVQAGADPVAWVQSHAGRIRSVHLKDWAPGTAEQEKSFRVLFGEGSSPWAPLIAALESVGGVELYLMEQEGSRFSEFETARRCLDSWKRMRRAR
jgi:sugar phosphate isomerase/epimerase